MVYSSRRILNEREKFTVMHIRWYLSQIGYQCLVIILIWGNLVTWRSKKYFVVSINSVEAKFHTMANAICECIQIKILLKELGINLEDFMKLFYDYQSALSIAENPVHYDKTKHIEINCYFINRKKKTVLSNYSTCQQSHMLQIS